MSRDTWLMMVKVVKADARAKQPKKRPRRKMTLEPKCVREEHFALLWAAGY
jgi:hypothetical protein